MPAYLAKTMTFRDLISEADYVGQRGVSIRSVPRERARCAGPPFIKMGRKVYCRPAAVEAKDLVSNDVEPDSYRDFRSFTGHNIHYDVIQFFQRCTV